MTTLGTPRLTAGGRELSLASDRFGFLRESTDVAHDSDEMRRRIDEDGYLFLPGFLDRDHVRAVRTGLLEALAPEGIFSPDHHLEEAVLKPGQEIYFRPDLANDPEIGANLRALIYSERVTGLADRIFGEPSRHYDFTWLRAVARGGTFPHCDAVYMGRGTHRVMTAWVPLGDVPLTIGGLIVLEGSHKDQGLLTDYVTLDVDRACDDGVNETQARGFEATGAISADFEAVRGRDGGRRWLTAREYRMGDLLLFTIHTAHGSLDNHSGTLRLSSDSRYQPASEPADERWVGEVPPGHGDATKIRMIC